MIRLLILCLLNSLLISSVMAKQVLSDGILQAYWKAGWNNNGTINTPELGFRYFPASDSRWSGKIINISVSQNRENELSFIKENFINVPDDFIKNQEWYINQTGNIALDNIRQYTDCGSDYYSSDLLHFTATPQSEETASHPPESVYNCSDNYPYLTKYYLKEDLITGYLRDNPSEKALNKYSFDNHDDIIKIRTVNKEWIYAAVYDENKPDKLGDKRGYVRLHEITPFY